MEFSEFVEKMQADDELKKEFFEVAQKQDADALIAFLAGKGCETTMEEVSAVMTGADKELSLDDLESAAGGFDSGWVRYSIVGGIIC